MDSGRQVPLEADVSRLSLSIAELGQTNVAGKIEAGNVGKTEGRADVGKSEKDCGKVEAVSVGKTEGRADVGKSEKDCGKVEAINVGKIRRADVGKSETDVGKVEAVNVGETEGRAYVGKSKKDIGKVEAVNAGKIEGRPEVEQSETGDAPGKLESKVNRETGKLEGGVTEKFEELGGAGDGQVGTVGKLGQSGNEATVKPPLPVTVKKATSYGAKVSVRNHGGQNDKSSQEELDSDPVKCVILVAAKGSEKDNIAAIVGNTEIKLLEATKMVADSEATDPSLREQFDSRSYFQNLHASQFGKFVLYSPLISSTHTLLSQNFHAFPQGTVCIASAQLQGKGRGGNRWESPKGCLMFSFTIKMTDGAKLPFLQYVVSLAVIEGIDENCKAMGVRAPEVRIKWPNDLYAKGLKIGGVLCTSTYSNRIFNIVVGVGLNVGNRDPTTCLETLIQELDPQAGPFKHEELLAAIMDRFEKLNEEFSSRGFEPLENSYYNKWLHSGQKIILEEKHTDSSELFDTSVTIRGLTRTGYLLAADKDDEEYELHPDGNSFDFLKGLVRTKLTR